MTDSITASGMKAIGIPTDIESEDSVVRLFDAVRKSLGRLDILVNCAGLIANQPLTQTNLGQWDDVHSLNLRATFICMREGIKSMCDAGHGGRIVNITTMGALFPALNGHVAYASARAGVTMLSKSAAADYVRDGILVNVVMPGAIPKTRFHPSTIESMNLGRKLTGPAVDPNRLPLGMGKGLDIAAAVLYLVSPAGSYITGQSIVLDGGFLVS